ncbi:MAG: DUF2804 domain-containing protein [Desulfobacteraceae bacterium]|nr:DUF2804 domain-containing protein [Desulfobacteraceae bacterium]
MEKIVNPDGSIRLGIFDTPVDEINGLDHLLLTASGRKVPALLKRLLYKGFHFIGITSPGIMAGIAVVDLGYLANTFAYVYHREDKWLEETSSISLLGRGAGIAPFPERPDSLFEKNGIRVKMDHQGVKASADGVNFQVEIPDYSAVPPLRICTRAGYRGWTFTRKAAPVPVSGTIEARGEAFELNPDDSFAISDWTGGFLRHKTFWNWAAIAFCLPDGRSLGLNLSWGVNETGFTENAFWVDSVMTKVDTVSFSKEDAGSTWHVKSYDGRVDLTFEPDSSRGEHVNALVVATAFTQCFGRFHGRLRTRDDEVISIDGVPGWTEDHFARW